MDLGEIEQTPTMEIPPVVAAAMATVDAQLKMPLTEIIAKKSLEGASRDWAMFELLLSCFHQSALQVFLRAWYGLLMQLGCWLSLSVSAAFPLLLCYFSHFAPRRDSLSKSGQNANVVHRSHRFSLHAGSEERRYWNIRMRRRKTTSFGRERFWFIDHCVITSAKTSLGLLVVSWKIGLLGVRVGKAAVLGPAAASHTQPNEKNHSLWET